MDTYTVTLKSARKELSELVAQRQSIDYKIAMLKQLIDAIIPFIESEALAAETARLISSNESDQDKNWVGSANEGITDSIKRVFVMDNHLTPTEVRDQLVMMGFDLSKHNNPMATIHSVLKRLVEQGWIDPVQKEGKPAFLKRVITYRNINEEIMQMAFEITRAQESIGPFKEMLSKIAEQGRATADVFSGKGSLPTKRIAGKKK